MSGLFSLRGSIISMGALFILIGSISCDSSSDTSSPLSSRVYPMFVDANANSINDYFERTTHNAGSPAYRVGVAVFGHAFVDENGDGVCDWAQNGSATWHGPGFIDDNGNGVCDYYDMSSPIHNRNGGMNYHDENGNGVNDYMEAQWHMGYGHDFTDADGDGVCDFAQDGSAGIFHGPGFVDNDGNGICDQWQEGGAGHGGGGMMGGGYPGPMPYRASR